MLVGLLEPLILSQGLASKKIVSYDSGSVAASTSTEVNINPSTDEIWIITRIIFGNINSAIWTGSFKHAMLDFTSTTTLEASFLSEPIDTWLEVTKNNKLVLGFKNTNISAESFDVTVHVFVIKSQEQLVKVRRLVRGVGNFFSLLGGLSFDPSYHDNIIQKVLENLFQKPSPTSAVTPIRQPEQQKDQPLRIAPDNYQDKSLTDSPDFKVGINKRRR